MQRPSDVAQVRRALRMLLDDPHPANFDRACALIERLPPKARSAGSAPVPADAPRWRAPGALRRRPGLN
jgi:hypothetical protein